MHNDGQLAAKVCVNNEFIEADRMITACPHHSSTNEWNVSQCEWSQQSERVSVKLHTDNAHAHDAGMQEIQLNIVLIKRKSFAQINGIISSDVQRVVADEMEEKPKEAKIRNDQR